MSDLQEIWNNIPENVLNEKEIENTINRKSATEIDRFKNVLKLEIYISAILWLPLWLIKDLFTTKIMVLLGLITITGWTLNVFTLSKLNQVQLLDDVKCFLARCIEAMKSFVIVFLITVQFTSLFIAIVVKSIKGKDIPLTEWLISPDGILLILLLVVINLVLLCYVWVFYIRRIQSLKRLLKEINGKL